MRFRLAVCFLLLAVVSYRPALAQVDITWSDCVVADPSDVLSPVNDVDFVCTGTATNIKNLYGSFKVPVEMPSFIAMDIDIDLEDETSFVLPAFWHWETGGCNENGHALSIDKLDTGNCNAMTTPWGDFGDQAIGVVAGYIPGFNRPNSARMIIRIARDASDPYPLASGTNYFAFQLKVITNATNRAICPGCGDAVAMVWNRATLYENTGHSIFITGPDKKSSCATINGASAAACAATPVKSETWGKLKALYR